MSKIDRTSRIKELMYQEQVGLLYKGSVSRPALHLISMLIFISVIHVYSNHVYILTWVAALLGLNIYRFLDISKTQKILDKIVDYKSLHIRYVICAGILGSIYSFGFILFFNDLPLLNQVYLLSLIAIMTPAGLVSFASDKITFSIYQYSLTLPVIIKLFSTGEMVYFNYGVCGIIYVLITKKLFDWYYKVLMDAVRLKFENEQLSLSLKMMNESLKEISVIDELTQVANRRSLDESLEKEWSRAMRTKTPISLLMIDIDHFKKYNDEFGHLKGDECLKTIAQFLKENLNRPADFIARFGGEEFSIIMPETNLNGAINFAEKIHTGVRELNIPNPGSSVSRYLTISIGIASVVPAKDDSYMDLIYTSDKALYQAKNDGRNLIRSNESLEKNPEPRLVV